jgi:hypothetical protein
MACLVYLSNFNDIYKITLAVASFAVIGYFENIRSSISRLAEDIFESIDESYVENLKVGKTHRVYREIIKKISESRFADSFPIEDIYCISLYDKKFRIVNTSKYIYNIYFDDFEKLLNILDGIDVVNNIGVTIDGKLCPKNLCIKITHDEMTYIYIVVFRKGGSQILLPFLVNSVLKLALARVANILAIEYKIRGVKKEYFDKLSENIEYFESAADTMHFLNNKFSPLRAFITMSERLEVMPQGDKRDRYELNAIKTRERAKKSLGIIIERAESLLEIKNELLFRSLEKCSISKLFSVVRKTWYEHFDSDKFEPRWKKEDFDKEVLINEDGFYYVISNIIDNMNKHNYGKFNVEFEQEGNKYIILFKNNYRKEDKDRLIRLAKEFMSEETQEIEMRKRNGLGIMKKILKQMPVDFEMSVSDEFFCFKLIFEECK